MALQLLEIGQTPIFIFFKNKKGLWSSPSNFDKALLILHKYSGFKSVENLLFPIGGLKILKTLKLYKK